MKNWCENYDCDECAACDCFCCQLKIEQESEYEPQIECACDRMQSEFCENEVCEGTFVNQHKCSKRRPRKTGSAYRRFMKKQKQDKLMDIINRGGYNPAAGYVDWGKVNGKWKPIGKYIKYPKNSHQQKFYKRYSNRKARREELPTKGNGYRKHFDYWWTLY